MLFGEERRHKKLSGPLASIVKTMRQNYSCHLLLPPPLGRNLLSPLPHHHSRRAVFCCDHHPTVAVAVRRFSLSSPISSPSPLSDAALFSVDFVDSSTRRVVFARRRREGTEKYFSSSSSTTTTTTKRRSKSQKTFSRAKVTTSRV